MMLSGSATCRRVSPFWPPGRLPDGSRELRVRGGFFQPVAGRRLAAIAAVKAGWRSNSAIRIFKAAISAACAWPAQSVLPASARAANRHS
jgi:hypothetical protein